ncbi:hypothetical protein HZB60_12375 [candidate division KSB1 bacterium]|nr:hypothetical protein [candidate division KSB1 bacterium]
MSYLIEEQISPRTATNEQLQIVAQAAHQLYTNIFPGSGVLYSYTPNFHFVWFGAPLNEPDIRAGFAIVDLDDKDRVLWELYQSEALDAYPKDLWLMIANRVWESGLSQCQEFPHFKPLDRKLLDGISTDGKRNCVRHYMFDILNYYKDDYHSGVYNRTHYLKYYL